MAYQKHEILGTNKDGSTPKRGPRTIHKTTEPVAHSHSRDFETKPGGSLGRDGRVPKRTNVEVHSGMHRTQGTNLGAPVTSSLVDDERMTVNVLPPNKHSTGQDKPGRLEPTVAKRTQTDVAPPVVGHRSRFGEVGPGCCVDGKSMNHEAAMRVGNAAHAARQANAAKIIAEGVIGHGDPNHPQHPANLRRR